ncbi:hypothetical protein [Solimonas variicoloris]|uniref:hypothetical protein n=1 Tax=Solimonas variicoloris TaxID=254408 RepID=UPI00039B309D|nr:hypothetical protein [Solimonas variicoloris]
MRICERRQGSWRAVGVALLALTLSEGVRAAPGEPLGPPLTVASSTDDTYYQSAVARSGSGDLVVVWRSHGGVRGRLLSAGGTPKGPDFLVANGDVGLPDVAIDGVGRFVVAWSDLGAAARGIYLRRYAADATPLGDAERVSDPFDARVGETAIQSPAIAMNAAGAFVVAWAQGRYVERGNWYGCGYGIGLCARIGGYSVRLRRYPGGDSGAAPALQTVDATGSAEISLLVLPLAAGSGEDRVGASMAPDGRFVVAWNRIGESLAVLSGVYARRYDAAGRPEGKRLVSLQRDQATPAVAMDAAGAYVVAYRRSARGWGDYDVGLHTRRYPADLGLGSFEARVNADDGGYPRWPAVASDAVGNYVVVWEDGAAIRARRYATGGAALDGGFTVAARDPLGLIEYPDVATDAGGGIAFVWDASDSDDSGGGAAGVTTSRIALRLYEGP